MVDSNDMADEPPIGAMPFLSGKGLLQSLWRHRYLFLAILCGAVVLSVVASIIIPARYLATGSVIVAEADPATRTSDVWAQKQGDPADLESQIMILRSGRLLKVALAQPGAYEAAIEECRNAGDACAAYAVDDPRLADKVAEHFSMAAVGRSRVLSISYNSALPETAMTMANALVTAYLDDQRGTQSNSREVAAKWLWQEIADLDREIKDRVAKIEAFRRQNGLVQGATASISSESLTNASQQLAAAQQTRAQAQAKLDAIRNMRSGQDLASSPMALENRTVADLKQQIATVGNQLAASSTVLGPRHPQRRMLEASMGLLQKQLTAEIDRITASAQKDLEAASSLVTSLQEQVAKAKDSAANALSDESSIEGMVRDVDAKRQLYTQLYQRASELESERRSLNGGARLVSLAELPTKPYFPKKTPMVAAGFTVGLFLAAAGCVLWDRFGASVTPFARRRRTSDMPKPDRPQPENRNIPSRKSTVLGILPALPVSGVVDRPDATLMTLMRRSLLSIGFQQGVKQLAVDLLDRYEGRPLLFVPISNGQRSASLAAMLTAHAMVKAGLNVLLVECAPSTQEYAEAFDLPTAQPKLGDLVLRRTEPSACVSPTQIPGLHVVSGNERDVDLIGSGRLQGLQDLLAWASPYDLVLISGPAIAGHDGIRALQMLADKLDLSVVLCADPEADNDGRLKRAEATIADIGMPLAGAVLLPSVGEASRPADPLARFRKRIA